MLFIFKKKHANFKPLSAWLNTSKTGRGPTTHQHTDRGALKRSNKVTKEMKSTAWLQHCYNNDSSKMVEITSTLVIYSSWVGFHPFETSSPSNWSEYFSKDLLVKMIQNLWKSHHPSSLDNVFFTPCTVGSSRHVFFQAPTGPFSAMDFFSTCLLIMSHPW